MNESQGKFIESEKKSQTQKVIYSIPFLCLSWNEKIRDGEQISGCQELEIGRGGDEDGCKRARGEILEVMELFCSLTMVVIIWIYKCGKMSRIKYKYTQEDRYNWWNLRRMDYISVNFLVVLLYYSNARCYHWRKLGEGYKGSLCIISYNLT